MDKETLKRNIDTERIKPQLLVRDWGDLAGVGGLHLDTD